MLASCLGSTSVGRIAADVDCWLGSVPAPRSTVAVAGLSRGRVQRLRARERRARSASAAAPKSCAPTASSGDVVGAALRFAPEAASAVATCFVLSDDVLVRDRAAMPSTATSAARDAGDAHPRAVSPNATRLVVGVGAGEGRVECAGAQPCRSQLVERRHLGELVARGREPAPARVDAIGRREELGGPSRFEPEIDRSRVELAVELGAEELVDMFGGEGRRVLVHGSRVSRV